MTDFSDRLKTALEKSGITQTQLADRLGITEVSVSRYVNGTRIPKALIVTKIAKVLNVPLEYLMLGKEPPTKHIEMIIDYLAQGDDFQYNDNRGILTRCCNCVYYDTYKDLPECGSDGIMYPDPDDYCSKAVRK